MKVILLKNVPGVGDAGDIKDVAPGFARNVLIPRKHAALATDESIKRVENKRAAIEKEAKQFQKDLAKTAEKLSSITLLFTETANDHGKLFAGIDNKRIADELVKRHGATITANQITLNQPIKELGESKVGFKISNDLKGEFTVKVDKKN